MRITTAALLLATSAPFATAAAADTTFTFTPITIAGSPGVQATAINSAGAYVAVLYDKTGTVTGSVLVDGGGTVTTLPATLPGFTPIHAEDINEAGDVVGWAQNPNTYFAPMLFYSGGRYVTHKQVTLIHPGSLHLNQPNPFGFGSDDTVFATPLISLSSPTYADYGTPPHLRRAKPFNRFNTAHSLSSTGIVAGTSYTLNGEFRVFVGQKGNFRQVLPPGALTSQGGFVNASGAVAGNYADARNVQHGFLAHDYSFTSFDMPARASNITVTKINDAGRVVGTYQDEHGGRIHAFLFNGSTVSSFGDYGSGDNVSVTESPTGQILLWDQNGQGRYASYAVSCSGSGC